MAMTQALAKPVAGKATAGKDKDFVELVGGTGGAPFDDGPLIIPGSTTNTIQIRSGAFLDAIQFILNNPQGGTYATGVHGGQGGEFSALTLFSGETIIQVTVSWGTVNFGGNITVITSISFLTSGGRSLAGGTPGLGGNTAQFNGSNIVGFAGRSGALIDALSVDYNINL